MLTHTDVVVTHARTPALQRVERKLRAWLAPKPTVKTKLHSSLLIQSSYRT